jgi:Spore germination protein.
MEKKSYISPFQIVLMLFITRLLFSSSYQSALNPGNSIQDILLSVPVAFVVNLIAAIPLLILLARHPGHDPVECTIKVAGRGLGAAVAILYFLFFIAIATLTLGNYENYFTTAVIPDVRAYVIGLYLIIVCLYGVLKGIESISRFGSIVAIFYFVILLTIFISIYGVVDPSLLKPIFYSGTKLFMQGIVMNFNLSYQVVILAFLTPFLRQGKSVAKTYTVFCTVAFLGLFLLEFAIVTVTGAFGAKQVYPLQLLSSLSHIGFFEELDAVDMVSWILNAVVTVTLNAYLAVNCLMKLGLNKHRKLVATLCCALVFYFSIMTAKGFYGLQMMMVSMWATMILVTAVVIIPLFVLIIDLIKGKVVQNAQNVQNVQKS